MNILAKKIKIETKLTLVTGLHIGGSSDNVEIGGIDNIVIRTARKIGDDKMDYQPYIPGSSLKGKMRCLLEQMGGYQLGDDRNPLGVNYLFGITEIKNGNNVTREGVISKLLVRDAYLDEDSVKLLSVSDNLSRYTENKWENSINRITGTADNPRQTERVPAGASFDVSFVINVWEEENDDDETKKSKCKSLVELLEKGMNALENDYLGGSGTRGYGQIEFSHIVYYKADNASDWIFGKVEDKDSLFI